MNQVRDYRYKIHMQHLLVTLLTTATLECSRQHSLMCSVLQYWETIYLRFTWMIWIIYEIIWLHFPNIWILHIFGILNIQEKKRIEDLQQF